jgi:hypothetical protein
MLSWLMAQGFKNTFTAASHPHTCTSAEILRAYLSLTAAAAKTWSPSIFPVTATFHRSSPTMLSLFELEDKVVAACPASNLTGPQLVQLYTFQQEPDREILQ